MPRLEPQPAKAILVSRGGTQRQLAEAVSSSANYIGDVLNGRQVPSDDLAARIAAVLGVTVDEAFRPFGRAAGLTR